MASNNHVALLRGINVGGKNKLPMKDLRALFEAAGCESVRSYIQSGNVVFQAPAALAKTIGSRLEADIESELGLKVPVVTRSAAQWTKILAANPYAGRDVPEIAQMQAWGTPFDRTTPNQGANR